MEIYLIAIQTREIKKIYNNKILSIVSIKIITFHSFKLPVEMEYRFYSLSYSNSRRASRVRRCPPFGGGLFTGLAGCEPTNARKGVLCTGAMAYSRLGPSLEQRLEYVLCMSLLYS